MNKNTIKKKISSILGIHNKFYNYLLLKYKNVSYTSYPKINGRLFIRGQGKIKLGENVVFNSEASANPIGGDVRMIIRVNPGALVKIGNNTGISNSAIICHNKITIGSHVKIGGSVKIYDTDFHSLEYNLRCDKKKDIPITKPIKIGDYCFIGAFSILLKGVSIGEKSIVGAGSVVTKSIPIGEIWAGNPAKFIKKISSLE